MIRPLLAWPTVSALVLLALASWGLAGLTALARDWIGTAILGVGSITCLALARAVHRAARAARRRRPAPELFARRPRAPEVELDLERLPRLRAIAGGRR